MSEFKKLAELGRIVEKDIYAELGFSTTVSKPALTDSRERNSGGTGRPSPDVFIAGQVYKKAIEKGLRQMIQLN